MKTTAKLTGFVMMLSFLVFVWLSHTDVLPGSFNEHFLGGIGMLILAIFGWLILLYYYDKDRNNDSLYRPLTFFYSLLLVFNAVLYICLKTAGMIGPYPDPKGDPSNMVLLGIFYVILAGLGVWHTAYVND